MAKYAPHVTNSIISIPGTIGNLGHKPNNQIKVKTITTYLPHLFITKKMIGANTITAIKSRTYQRGASEGAYIPQNELKISLLRNYK